MLTPAHSIAESSILDYTRHSRSLFFSHTLPLPTHFLLTLSLLYPHSHALLSPRLKVFPSLFLQTHFPSSFSLTLIPRYCPLSYFPHSHFFPFLSIHFLLFLSLPFTLSPLISLSPLTLGPNLHILCFSSQTLPLSPYTYSPLFSHLHFPFLSYSS